MTFFRTALVCLLLPLWGGCAASTSTATDPSATLQSYAHALEEGRLAEAYALLSAEAKKSIPFETFQRIAKENPEEIRALGRDLARPTGPALVRATVTGPNGDSVLLVFEDGAWHVDGSALDLYSQATPDAAVLSFIRGFENGRYDVLMRFVPDSKLEGLDAQKLKQAWEGEQREEMEQLVQALKVALPTARFELLGERATMAYGAGGTIELLREHGVWKVEEFR
jgi:hypothetical protein